MSLNLHFHRFAEHVSGFIGGSLFVVPSKPLVLVSLSPSKAVEKYIEISGKAGGGIEASVTFYGSVHVGLLIRRDQYGQVSSEKRGIQ